MAVCCIALNGGGISGYDVKNKEKHKKVEERGGRAGGKEVVKDGT